MIETKSAFELHVLKVAQFGGMVTSWLVHSTPDQAFWVQARPGHCIIFLGKTFYSQSACLYPGVQMGTGDWDLSARVL